MPRRKFSIAERSYIELRAGRHCEYCKSSMDFTAEIFHIEHIIPVSKGGTHELSNLALSCSGCNIRKGLKTIYEDELGRKTPFFNPRIDLWQDHFEWNNDFSQIVSKTEVGFVTLETFEMNRPSIINLRKALVKYGVFPP
jgi:hypothetical protein